MVLWAYQNSPAVALTEVTLGRGVVSLLALLLAGYPSPAEEGLRLAPHPHILGGCPSSLAKEQPRLTSFCRYDCLHVLHQVN